ncbi:hypothetical protein EJ06DRAFT_549644 [Trichodelitschia bisporula]|uniref:Transcription elongation factor Eaf N-terminal domain-containing protein n=1 Tax=Trichodelitschia bisporula TaxID=703511 RepID=A0A6G1HUT1_9PEZI|nr:hypothetical protein EJ06DRAFT_549644 [Trichodelitschia bisporula]
MSSSPSSAAPGLDPYKPGRYTIKLGESITNKNEASNIYTSIRYNHKPPIPPSNPPRTTTLTATSPISLSITDGAEEPHTYTGTRHSSSRSYVVVFDEPARTATLERLPHAFTFNLKSSPTGTKYPQLKPRTSETSTNAGSDHDTGSSGDDGDADPNNPYDVRNVLRTWPGTPKSMTPSAAPTPVLAPKPKTLDKAPLPSKPRPAPRVKAKGDPLRPAPRAKAASPEPSAPTKSEAKNARPPIPSVRLDRRASTRPGDTNKGLSLPGPGRKAKAAEPKFKSEEFVRESDEDADADADADADDEDMEAQILAGLSSVSDDEVDAEGEEDFEMDDGDGGLEIDMGDAPPKQTRKLVLPHGGPATGPISLHSAANSPGSGLLTPRKREESREVRIDFGFENGTAEDEEDVDGDVVMGGSEDGEGEEDVDVEPIALGSPVHQAYGEQEEVEDPLEAALLQEFGAGEESEESEAE